MVLSLPILTLGAFTRLKLAGDKDGSGVLPFSSCANELAGGYGQGEDGGGITSPWVQKELEERARRPPDCQLALLFTTPPTFAVASGMAGMDVDVEAFVFMFLFMF